MEGRSTELINTRGIVGPKFFYTFRYDTGQLLRANFLTGEQSCLQIPEYQFKNGCSMGELPRGCLLITGGYEHNTAVREVVEIDTLRECAVSSLPPMHTARCGHAAVYHSQYLYVLGGYQRKYLSECERYVCEESRWEELPVLPLVCCAMSLVVLDNSLYALGGFDGRDLDTVQKLSLDSLTWELMQLKLPQAVSWFACFKKDTEVHLVIKETLYSFTPLQVKPMKRFKRSISQCRKSYYCRYSLYYSDGYGIKRWP
jgi:hypothetical protein